MGKNKHFPELIANTWINNDFNDDNSEFFDLFGIDAIEEFIIFVRFLWGILFSL